MRKPELPWVSLAFVAASLLTAGAAPAHAATKLEKMPSHLETQLALSALPPHLRDGATVYLLDPAKGYDVSRKGTNAFSCLVTRTYWFKADFRDDIYDPGCFDSVGVQNNLKVWMDTAALRASGRSPVATKQEIARRFAAGVYKAPTRFGLSYMVAPLMRTYTNTVDDSDTQVMTMSYPHIMYYAPDITDADLGPNPRGTMYPQALLPGPHGYVIQGLGSTETAQVVSDQHHLLDALCRYREVLCLNEHTGSH
jgi:hypothetical protein